MNNALKPHKEFFSESEAAAALGISLERLHQLLDKNIFNDGSKRPSDVTFRAADLILLKFWDRGPVDHKVLQMPYRRA
ncbi:MAG TPA: hypothetical protein VFZ99_03460 [Terriglobales bacterium]